MEIGNLASGSEQTPHIDIFNINAFMCTFCTCTNYFHIIVIVSSGIQLALTTTVHESNRACNIFGFAVFGFL